MAGPRHSREGADCSWVEELKLLLGERGREPELRGNGEEKRVKEDGNSLNFRKTVREQKLTCNIMVAGRGLCLAIFLLFLSDTILSFDNKEIKCSRFYSAKACDISYFEYFCFSLVKYYQAQVSSCNLSQIRRLSTVRAFMQPWVKIQWGIISTSHYFNIPFIERLAKAYNPIWLFSCWSTFQYSFLQFINQIFLLPEEFSKWRKKKKKSCKSNHPSSADYCPAWTMTTLETPPGSHPEHDAT